MGQRETGVVASEFFPYFMCLTYTGSWRINVNRWVVFPAGGRISGAEGSICSFMMWFTRDTFPMHRDLHEIERRCIFVLYLWQETTKKPGKVTGICSLKELLIGSSGRFRMAKDAKSLCF